MSLFDSLLSGVVNTLSTQTDSPLLRNAANLIANHEGGIEGLLASFRNQGLGEAVSSWIGTGANTPLSAENLQNVLGEGRIAEVAQSLGLSHGDAAGQLAEALPGLIDKLTPNGQLDLSSITAALGRLR